MSGYRSSPSATTSTPRPSHPPWRPDRGEVVLPRRYLVRLAGSPADRRARSSPPRPRARPARRTVGSRMKTNVPAGASTSSPRQRERRRGRSRTKYSSSWPAGAVSRLVVVLDDLVAGVRRRVGVHPERLDAERRRTGRQMSVSGPAASMRSARPATGHVNAVTAGHASSADGGIASTINAPPVGSVAWSSSRSTGQERHARPRASCSSTPPRGNGVFIPTLCHDDKLDPYGGCRMCVVGVEGSPRPLPACATRVAEGMVVSTNSAVPQFRRTLTEMLLAEHLNPDPGGRPNELADMAEDSGPRRRSSSRTRSGSPTTTATSSWATTPTPASSATAASATRKRSCSAPRSRSRAAGRTHASSRRRATPGSTPSASSAAAASRSARPVRSTRSSRRAPSAPEPALEKVKTTCTFCGVGCQIDINVDPETKRIVKVTSDPTYVSNEGNLCVKGRFAFNFVHHPDRLTEPLVRGEDGELHPTTWEHALETAAAGLGACARARGAVDRLPRVGAPDDGGELPHPEARADGDRDELRPLLRSHLTRSDSFTAWSGRWAGRAPTRSPRSRTPASSS